MIGICVFCQEFITQFVVHAYCVYILYEYKYSKFLKGTRFDSFWFWLNPELFFLCISTVNIRFYFQGWESFGNCALGYFKKSLYEFLYEYGYHF